jgi:hypothetical protein
MTACLNHKDMPPRAPRMGTRCLSVIYVNYPLSIMVHGLRGFLRLTVSELKCFRAVLSMLSLCNSIQGCSVCHANKILAIACIEEAT